VIGVTSQDDQKVRAAYLLMGPMITWVLVPFAFAALLTGLTSSLGTHWGLFRHYWVIVKLVLTVVSLVVLLVQVEPIHALAERAADSTSTVVGLHESRRPLVHAAGGLVVLLVVQALGIYKPQGMTRYGWRKQHEKP
jgi:hypothetical protein